LSGLGTLGAFVSSTLISAKADTDVKQSKKTEAIIDNFFFINTFTLLH